MCTFVGYGQEGQLANGGFENWEDVDSTVEITDWYYRRILGTDLVQRVAPGKHGLYALRLETIERNDDTLTSYVCFARNSSLQYEHYTSYVDSLVFWARWDFKPGDTGMVHIIQYIDGNPQPVGHRYEIHGKEETWTRLAFNCISPAQDSMRVLIHTSSWGTDDIDTPGSYLELDNVHFVNYNSTPEPLPNYSFEDWYVNKYAHPVGFYSRNDVMIANGRKATLTRSTDAYEGQYSAKLEVDSIGGTKGVLTNAFYQNWALESGAPYSAMPDSFSGFYKADVVAGDSAYFQFYFSRDDTIRYYYSMFIDSTVDWTPINLTFDLDTPPDSLRIYCRSSNQLGSAVYFDAFQFHGGDLSVKEKRKATIGAFPNPVDNQCTVWANSVIKKIELLDLQGRLLQTHHPQSEKYLLDLEKLASGKYFVVIYTDDEQVGKMIEKR